MKLYRYLTIIGIICLISAGIASGAVFADDATPPAPAPISSTELPVVTNPGTVTVTNDISTNTQTWTAPELVSVMELSSGNVGSNATLKVDLPTDDSRLLAKVNSPTPTYWEGKVFCPRGFFVFENQSGINIGPQAQVNVANFIATTLDINVNSFRNGNYEFIHDASKTYAAIANQGTITANNLALVASAVDNSGIIVAKVGVVHLASGNKTTVSFDRRGLIQVEVSEATTGQVLDENMVPIKDAIRNSGTIEAGAVYMSAKTAGDIFENAVNHTGTGYIKTTGMIEKDGVIKIVAIGNVKISGKIESNNSDVIIDTPNKLTIDGPITVTGGAVKIGTITPPSTVESTLYKTITADSISIFTQSINHINTATPELNLYKTSGDIIITASKLEGPLVTIEGEGINVTYLKSSKVTFKTDGLIDTQNQSIISAQTVTLIANRFGTSVTPLKIDTDNLTIKKESGSITILDTIGIGQSIFMTGPPEDLIDTLNLCYNYSAKLSLDAPNIEISGSSPTTLLGDITFSCLTITTPGKVVSFESGHTFTILGTLTVRGVSGNNVTLKSTQSGVGNEFHIYVEQISDGLGHDYADYITINNSIATGPLTPLQCRNETEYGTTTGWDANFYWVGGNGNWSEYATHWATTSGGSTFYGNAPTSADNVYFDSNSGTAAVNIDSAATCLAMTLSGTFGGTITQAATLTISGDYSQSTGTFSGGSQAIDIEGSYTISGGTFTSTSGTLSVAKSFTKSGSPTWSAHGGLVAFDGTFRGNSSVNAPGVSFNLVNINRTTSNASYTFTIEADTTIPLGDNPNSSIVLDNPFGNADYNLTNNGTITVGTGTWSTTVDGLFTNNGTISGTPTKWVMYGNFTNNSGKSVTFNSITELSFLRYYSNVYGVFTNNGTCSFSSLTTMSFDGNFSSSATGSFTMSSSSTSSTCGGGFVVNSSGAFSGGIMTLTMGDGPLAGDVSLDASLVTFEKVIINRTIYVSGTVSITIASGTTVPLGDSPTVYLYSAIPANVYNLTNNGTITVGTGTFAANVEGAFTNNGTIITKTATKTSSFGGGTYSDAAGSTIKFIGDGDGLADTQTITSWGTSFANVTIDATDELLDAFELGSAPTISENVLVNKGILDSNNYALNPTGTITVKSGAALRLAGGETVKTPSLESGSTVIYDSTGGPHTIYDWGYHNLTISGSGGSFNLGALESLGGNLTVTAGTFDLSTFDMAVTGNITVNGGTLDASDPDCDLDITGNVSISSGTLSAPAANDTTSFMVGGSWSVTGSGIFTPNLGKVYFRLSGSKNLTASSSGADDFYNVAFDNSSGSWTLLSGVTALNSMELTSGSIDASTFNISCANFSSSNSNTRTITMGSGNWTLTGTGTVWDTSTATNLTVNGNSSTIIINDTSASSKTFTGGGKTFSNITISGDNVIIDGSNTFNAFALNNAGLTNGCKLTNGTTQTVSSFTSNGSAGNLTKLVSTTPGSAATLSKSSGKVSVDYIYLQDSTATGGAAWFAGSHSTNIPVNTGWYFEPPPPYDRIISSAGGNWSDAAAWLEGIVPTASETVGAYPESGNVTISADAYCKSIDLTNYVGILTHNAGYKLYVGNASAGSLKFVAGMTYTLIDPATSAVNFVSTTTGNTVTTAGKTFGNVTFNGVGGGWTLQDSLTTGSSATVTLTNGTLDTNGQTLTIGAVSSSNSNTRTLTLGNSTISCQATGTAWDFTTATNLTFNCNTSSITLSGASSTFAGGGKTFNAVLLTGSGTQAITGANTYASLTRTGTAVKADGLQVGATQTVSGTLTLNGNSSVNRLLITSDTLGTARTLSAATVSVTNADFRDITGSGAGSWNLAAITGLSGNCGGNSGITFTTAATQYWHVDGGNWSDSGKWFLATNGGGGAGRVPLPQDSVVFDLNSFDSNAQTITADMPRLGLTITWTGATHTPTLDMSSTDNTMYGSLTLISGMSLTGSKTFIFEGRGSYNLTNATRTWPANVTIQMVGGTLTTKDQVPNNAITITGDLTINNGTLTHDQNTTSELFKLDITVGGAFTLGSSGTINLDGKGNTGSSGTGKGTDVGGNPAAGTGAGYGGTGGSSSSSATQGIVYGSITEPINIGSGGGYGSSSGWTPGYGGGAVKISATGVVTINGTITANGTAGVSGGGWAICSGGGSGGSVYIRGASIVTTAGSPILSVNGGAGGYGASGYTSGGGGGGRIALYSIANSTVDTFVSAATVRAYGGLGGNSSTTYGAGAGTIYTKNIAQVSGALIVNNNNQTYGGASCGVTSISSSMSPYEYTFDSITVRNRGFLYAGSGGTISYTTMNFATNGIVGEVCAIGASPSGTFNFASDFTVPYTDASNYGTYYANKSHSFNSLTVNGVLSHFNNTYDTITDVYRIDISVSTYFTLGSTGTVSLDAKGFIGANGPGKGGSVGGNPAAGAGAGYGGTGGSSMYTSTQGTTYGSITEPVNIGSGGGYGNSSGYTPGVGGGAVKIVALGVVTLNGSISANGSAGYSDGTWAICSGGGSGGSVYISGSSIVTSAGAPVISVNGGAGGLGAAGTIAGGGGGGRIALYSTADSTVDTFLSTATVRAYGALGGNSSTAYAGGAGTIYTKNSSQTYGSLIINNNGYAPGASSGKTLMNTTMSPSAYTFDAMIIRNYGSLKLGGGTITIVNLTVENNGGIYNPDSAYTLHVTGNYSQTSAQTVGGANQTIEFSGSAIQSFSKSAGTFSSLIRVNKTGTNALELATALTTSGSSTTTVAEGVFSLKGYAFSSAGAFTVEDGGTLRMQGAETPTSPTLNSGSTVEFTGNGTGTSNTYTITDFKTTYHHLTINSLDGITDTFQLGAGLTVNGTMTLTAGAFTTVNNTVNAANFSSSNANARTITMGSNTWTLTGTGTVWDTSTATNLTLNGDTSTIVISDTGASSKTFSGGGKTYHDISITGSGAGAVIIDGSNTFTDFTINAPKTVTFTSGTTQTISGTFTATGTAGNIITINASGGTVASLSNSGTRVTCDYLSLTNSAATGAATWFAGSHSTNVSGNTGWIFSDPPDRTIAPGGGNWNNPATWVEGSVPTASQTVGATSASGNVTIDAAAYCRSIDLTGYTGTLTHNSGVTLYVGDASGGSLKFVSGMTYTLLNSTTSAVNFVSTTTGNNVTTGGKTFGNITFNGSGGGWTLQDGLTTGSSATITLTQGTLNTNGQTLTIGKFSSSNSNTRTLTLGASSITCQGSGTPWDFGTSTNLTFNCNTSTITCSGSAITFSGGGKTFNNVYLVGGAGTDYLSGANTFANLTRTGTAITSEEFRVYANQIITGTLTLTGNSITNRLLFKSDDYTTARTINAANVSISNTDFECIAASGAANWNLSLIAGGSGDCGGNTGITFTTAQTNYWVGNGGNWSSSTAHWANSSGGTGGTGRVPLPQDDIRFDGNSFSTSGQTVTNHMTRAGKNIDWTGVTNNPTWSLYAGNEVTCYGSLTLSPSMTLSQDNMGIQFFGRGDYTLTSCNAIYNGNNNVRMVGGSLTLLDDYNQNQNGFYVDYGGFNANNHNITTYTFGIYSGMGYPRTITMGSGTWTVTNWYSSSGNLTFNSGTSKLILTGNGTFNGSNLTYYDLSIASGAGTISINGGNTWHNVLISGPKTVTFESGKTQTINGTFSATGTAGNIITINASGGTAATLSKTTGRATCDYLSLTNSSATGGAVWFAGAHSTNVSGNSGWLFESPPSVDRLISAAGGNWTSASAWVEGIVPTADESVGAYSMSGNITINAAASCKSIDLTGYAGTVTHNAGATLSIGNATAGSLKFTAAMTYTPADSTSVIRFTSTAAGNTITSAGKTFASLVFDGVGGAWSFAETSETISYNLTLSNGTLTIPTATLYVAGDWAQSGTGALSGTGEVIFNGASGSTSNISGSTTFDDLTCIIPSKILKFEHDKIQYITGTLNISGQATGTKIVMNSDDNTNRFSLQVGSPQTIYYVSVSNSQVTGVAGNNITGRNSTKGTNVKTTDNPRWIFGIDISGSISGITSIVPVSIAVNGVVVDNQSTDISGNFSFAGVDVNDNDMFVIYVNNGLANPASLVGMVVDSQTNVSGLVMSLNHIYIGDSTGSVGTTFTNTNLNSAYIADTDILYSVSGAGPYTLTFADNVTLLVPTAVTYAPAGDVTAQNIHLNGSFTPNAYSVTVHGDWDNTHGLYTSIGSTTFDTTAVSTISGSTTFYDFTCATAGKTLTLSRGAEQTVSHSLTLTGSSSNPVVINDTGVGAAPKLTLQTGKTQSITNVSVTNNDASGGLQLVARGTSSITGTTNWVLGSTGTSFIWTGAVSTDWNNPANWNLGVVPSSTDTVTIPSGTPNQPALANGVTLRGLTVNGTMDAGSSTVSVTGSITGTGTITGVNPNISAGGIIGTRSSPVGISVTGSASLNAGSMSSLVSISVTGGPCAFAGGVPGFVYQNGDMVFHAGQAALRQQLSVSESSLYQPFFLESPLDVPALMAILPTPVAMPGPMGAAMIIPVSRPLYAPPSATKAVLLPPLPGESTYRVRYTTRKISA